jgi:hypothetical protein
MLLEPCECVLTCASYAVVLTVGTRLLEFFMQSTLALHEYSTMTDSHTALFRRDMVDGLLCEQRGGRTVTDATDSCFFLIYEQDGPPVLCTMRYQQQRLVRMRQLAVSHGTLQFRSSAARDARSGPKWVT